MEPLRKMQKRGAKQACKAKIKEMTRKCKRRNSGSRSHSTPKKQQKQVLENGSGPLDPLIPNQDQPDMNPEKQTDPKRRENSGFEKAKPTDTGIGPEKKTHPETGEKKRGTTS